MPRNGSGGYQLPTPPTPFTNGTTADATQVNAVLTDIATALTGSMAADGQTPFTGSLSLTHPLVLANGVAVQGKDTSGAVRQLIALTNANNLDVVNAGGGSIRFVNQAYNAVLGAFDNAGNFTAASVVASGNVYGANYNGNNGHTFNFGWNGSILAYVDGIYIAPLQLQGGAVAWGTLTGVPAICYNNGNTYGINITGNAATASSATTAGTCSGNAATASSAATVNAGGNSFGLVWDGSHLQFSINGGSIGTINYTISDPRLKHSVAPLDDDAWATVLALRPVSYRLRDWGPIVDDGKTRLGFMADELQHVIPSAVRGEAGAVDQDGAILPQSLDPMPIIAMLTKSLQEAMRRIEALEARR